MCVQPELSTVSIVNFWIRFGLVEKAARIRFRLFSKEKWHKVFFSKTVTCARYISIGTYYNLDTDISSHPGKAISLTRSVWGRGGGGIVRRTGVSKPNGENLGEKSELLSTSICDSWLFFHIS